VPGPMPYHLEKGPWICALEEHLNKAETPELQEFLRVVGDAEQYREFLRDYAQDDDLNGDPVFRTVDQRMAHLTDHWYGDVDGKPHESFEMWLRRTCKELRLGELPEDASIEAVRELVHSACQHGLLEHLAEPPADGPDHEEPRRTWPTTGWWRQYYGNVEEIVRVTLANAIAISLGLPQPDAKPTRRLHLEIFWKCGQPWFEGWLTWTVPQKAPTSGQMTLIFATPGIGRNVLTEAASGGNVQPSPYRVLPEPADRGTEDRNRLAASRGMMVVTHQLNLLLPPVPSTLPTTSGSWIIPAIGPSYAGVGDVVPVEPSFENGGVRDPQPVPDEEQPRSKAAPEGEWKEAERS
jgi:hypothetical protein